MHSRYEPGSFSPFTQDGANGYSTSTRTSNCSRSWKILLVRPNLSIQHTSLPITTLHAHHDQQPTRSRSLSATCHQIVPKRSSTIYSKSSARSKDAMSYTSLFKVVLVSTFLVSSSMPLLKWQSVQQMQRSTSAASASGSSPKNTPLVVALDWQHTVRHRALNLLGDR